MTCPDCGRFHTEHVSLCTCGPLTRLARQVDALTRQVGYQRRTIEAMAARLDAVQQQTDRQDDELTAQLGQLQNLEARRA